MSSIGSFAFGMLVSPVFVAALLFRRSRQLSAEALMLGITAALDLRPTLDSTKTTATVKQSSAIVGALVGLLIIESALFSALVWIALKP